MLSAPSGAESACYSHDPHRNRLQSKFPALLSSQTTARTMVSTTFIQHTSDQSTSEHSAQMKWVQEAEEIHKAIEAQLKLESFSRSSSTSSDLSRASSLSSSDSEWSESSFSSDDDAISRTISTDDGFRRTSSILKKGKSQSKSSKRINWTYDNIREFQAEEGDAEYKTFKPNMVMINGQRVHLEQDQQVIFNIFGQPQIVTVTPAPSSSSPPSVRPKITSAPAPAPAPPLYRPAYSQPQYASPQVQHVRYQPAPMQCQQQMVRNGMPTNMPVQYFSYRV